MADQREFRTVNHVILQCTIFCNLELYPVSFFPGVKYGWCKQTILHQPFALYKNWCSIFEEGILHQWVTCSHPSCYKSAIAFISIVLINLCHVSIWLVNQIAGTAPGLKGLHSLKIWKLWQKNDKDSLLTESFFHHHSQPNFYLWRHMELLVL